MFCNSGLMKRLRNKSGNVENDLQRVFSHDVILVPFFYGESQQSYLGSNRSQDTFEVTPTGNLTTMLVVIQTKTMQVDLFNKTERNSVSSKDDQT